MIGETPRCLECQHYNWQDSEKMSCKAFPKGIPDAIIMGEYDHKHPYKGDHGIRFEPKKKRGSQ